MYHISKNKSKTKPFSVVNLSESGEVLSEHKLKTKQACFKNIISAMDEIEVEDSRFDAWVNVQDDTVIPAKGYTVDVDGFRWPITNYDPKPQYIPGKNPSKKKKSAKK